MPLHTLPYSICAVAILMMASLLPSCHDHRNEAVKALLAHVDTLMFSDPDSALLVLDRLPDTITDRETAAWRDLLTVKLSFKNFLEIQDINISRRPYLYYLGHNDSLEIQANYYFGSLLAISDQEDSALIVLTKNLSLAKTNNDYFYAAMSARALSDLYSNLLIPEKEYDYAIEAKELYHNSGHNVHAAWMDLLITDALAKNQQYDELLDRCNNVDTSQYNNISFFRHQILLNKAIAHYIKGNYDKVTLTYDTLKQDNYDMTGHDWSILGNALSISKEYAESHIAIDSAKTYDLMYNDSILIMLAQSRILADQGKYSDAYNFSIQSSESLNRKIEYSLMHPKTLLLSDYLNLEAEANALEAKTRNRISNMIMIFSTIIVSLLIIIIIILNRKRKASQTILKLKEIAFESCIHEKDTKIKESLDIILRERKQSETSINELHCIIDRIKNEKNDTIIENSKFISLFYGIWNEYIDYKTNCSQKINIDRNLNLILRKYERVITSVNNTTLFDHLITIADKNNGNLLTKLQHLIPTLSKEEYYLIGYSLIGLDATAIAYLMNRSSPNAVYQLRHRLKSKLKQTTDPEIKNTVDAIWTILDGR